MDLEERETPWIKRVEELILLLEGSSIGELELTEAGTEIIIKRRPDLTMISVPQQQVNLDHDGIQVAPGNGVHQALEEHSLSILSPTTGVYYNSPEPSSPAFVNAGDILQVGQLVALIEAMKVFNEVHSEVSGRVVELVAVNGEVVHKGDVIIKLEPV